MSEELKPALRTPPAPALSLRTVVGHGLEIFAQVLGKKLNIDMKPLAKSSIDEFVRANVSDEPISLRPMLEDAGFIRREKRKRRLR